MATKKIPFSGTVDKIVRKNGSDEVQVTMTMLASNIADFPIGAVTGEIQTLQSSMFGDNKPIRGKE